MNWLRNSITAKAILAIILLGLVTVAVAAVALYQAREVTNTAERVSHTQEVFESLESVLSELKDAETGQRGFLLTSDETYLEPYNSGLAKIFDELKQFKTLTSDNPNQQRRIESLRPLIDEKLAELKETIDLHRSGQTEQALDVIKTDQTELRRDIDASFACL